ncbi:MAG TPA: hypothetical protein VGS97_19140 [Actinocrinis sp.]|uniref:hypothetical protein n=1 Tax=Actinocrinis sp. TaxID=1920516 RepID=UPI002DDDA028|nr:hypothetical protein [Actinocrinis sp.]HEV2346223.1 hypothetical protein [Actinocrinis sp.]
MPIPFWNSAWRDSGHQASNSWTAAAFWKAAESDTVRVSVAPAFSHVVSSATSACWLGSVTGWLP